MDVAVQDTPQLILKSKEVMPIQRLAAVAMHKDIKDPKP